MIVQFRFHRGSLLDSLNTSIFFKDVESMIEYLNVKYDYIRLDPYYNKPDPRCGWDFTSIVLTTDEHAALIPIGFYTFWEG